MPFIELQHSFDKTNFDLENGAPSGGPINASNYGHQHTYTPQNKFIDSPEGSKQGGNLKNDGFSGNPAVPGTGFLDLENNGPTNVANYNHQQNWTPTDEFILSPEGSKQGGNLKNDGFDGPSGIPGTGFLDLENNGPNNEATYGHEQLYTPQDGQGYEDSPQGKIRSTDSAAEENNFKTSGLDLEDPLAGARQGGTGGPNRTNAIQSKKGFNSGQYTVTRAGGLGIGNIAGMKGQGGGVITQTLHTYTPQNPYFDAGGLDLTPIGSPQSVNQQPFTPKNNVVVSDKTTFYDATINTSVPSRNKFTLPVYQRIIK